MSPYIDQAMLCGDKRNYLVAVVAPNRESILQCAAEKSIQSESYPSLLRTEEIATLLRNEVEETTEELASYEKVKAFAIVDEEFSIENELLTATLKLRRGKVADRYCDLIEAMYSGDKAPREHGCAVFM
jgi:long-chain acyl-CoA synthetase